MLCGLILTIIISNFCTFISDGYELDELRNNVLRLHILADSDSSEDQQLKLMVRDAVLRHSDEIFGDAESFDEACRSAEENLGLIKSIAAETLAENGCTDKVSARLERLDFDERVYGDITMPAGEYTALRIEIGSAQGHNWWCVMYPQLCIPVVCKETAGSSEETVSDLFTPKQRDILTSPKKYEVRFAVWDKLKEVFGDS